MEFKKKRSRSKKEAGKLKAAREACNEPFDEGRRSLLEAYVKFVCQVDKNPPQVLSASPPLPARSLSPSTAMER
jgi:hypothetical protein